MADGQEGQTYWPLAFVVVLTTMLVSMFRASMFALATTEPVVSVTVPVMVPRNS